VIRESVRAVAQEMMEVEVSELIGAERGEVSVTFVWGASTTWARKIASGRLASPRPPPSVVGVKAAPDLAVVSPADRDARSEGGQSDIS